MSTSASAPYPAVFPAMIELLMVESSSQKMPPPSLAVLPEIVQLVRVFC